MIEMYLRTFIVKVLVFIDIYLPSIKKWRMTLTLNVPVVIITSNCIWMQCFYINFLLFLKGYICEVFEQLEKIYKDILRVRKKDNNKDKQSKIHEER